MAPRTRGVFFKKSVNIGPTLATVCAAAGQSVRPPSEFRCHAGQPISQGNVRIGVIVRIIIGLIICMETAAVRQGSGSMWRLVCVAAMALLGVIRLLL